MRSFLFIVPTLLLAAVSGIGIIILQSQQLHLHEEPLTKAAYVQKETQEEQQLQMTKNIPTLGLDNFLADWLYLQFIQYFGDSEAREEVGYQLSPIYFQQIVKQDPRFVDAMLKIETATSIFAGFPEISVESLDKSIESIPPPQRSQFLATGSKPYYLEIYKGINQLLFLGQPQKASKSYQRAADWAKIYSDEDSQRIVSNTRRTAHFLANNPDSKVAQIGAWIMVLSNNSDPRTVQKALTAIQSLGGEIITQADGNISIRVPPDTK